MKILVLNSGSSSQKSCLYDIEQTSWENPPAPLWEGRIQWEGTSAEISIRNYRGANLNEKGQTSSRPKAIEQLLDTLCSGEAQVLSDPSEISVVGHRVVHGGGDYTSPVVVTAAVKSAIARLAVFAPLHNRAELDAMDIIEKRMAAVPQVAVFDTGFHRTLPEPAYVYPGPYDWLAHGIRRYGFHGINHEYCAHRAAQILRTDLESLRIVSCHLGNGCSLAAVCGGQSIDTTMGFTPLEGLMMGTRSGSIDPSILTFLMRQNGLDADELDDLLNKHSGLLGVSGISADVRKIVASMNDGHIRARLAFDIFVHRLRAGIASMAASMNGMDTLIFTGGIGENSAEVRSAVCANLNFLGAELDTAKNAAPMLDGTDGDRNISHPDSRVKILIIRAQEDWAIARACWHLLAGDPAKRTAN